MQQLFHGLGFVLVCLTAQCIKCKFHLSIPPISKLII
ncbi:hypothetical protein EVA_16726 [gut metagenome]|uniref:Uncharacterized protein n=1 Tax=gut metagenome TaxID=749906 RepID=J9G6P7_9ZZZZ